MLCILAICKFTPGTRNEKAVVSITMCENMPRITCCSGPNLGHTTRASFCICLMLFFSYSYSQLGAVRLVPWAKKNINYTGQALIISAGMVLNSVFQRVGKNHCWFGLNERISPFPCQY